MFASWCDPCKAEAPILEQEQKQLARHNATILGVTYLDNSSDSEQFVRQQHITYPVVRDVSGNFVRSFGTTGVPETFVINRNGQIAALRRYQIDNQWLAADAATDPGAARMTVRRAALVADRSARSSLRRPRRRPPWPSPRAHR